MSNEPKKSPEQLADEEFVAGEQWGTGDLEKMREARWNKMCAERRMIGRGVPISPDDPAHPEQRYKRFQEAIETQINYRSMENGSDTPDFILAEFLTDMLRAFDKASKAKDAWYGGSHRLLKSQLEAEGEHTVAANANIDRLNTEIERITRRQQGELAGKG